MIQPLHDRILVRPAPADEVSAGGILLPDSVQEKPHQGEVLAVGQGKTENGYPVIMTVAKGDIVIYGKYSGTEVKDTETGEALLIMRESDIFATIV